MDRKVTLYQRLSEVIPGGVNSPVRSFKEIGRDPVIIKSAKGSSLFDIEGNTYIDYCLSWGAIILGHADSEILNAVSNRMLLGTTFGASCEIEEKLARKIVKNVPSIEKVRFVSSGTEATMSAVRLARGYTGRDKIVKFDGNYHGHADFFLVKAGSSARASTRGVPQSAVQDTISLPYNDPETVRQYLRNNPVAAVILEPIAGNMGVIPATQEFLQTLREETTKTGALLIFDEVITGFRVALGGAQSLFGVTPDLTTLGKIIGGGFPVGAFGGRTEIMDCLSPIGDIFQAGTLSGNPVAMEAGYQTLCRLEKPGFYGELERKARLLTDPIQSYIEQTEYPAALQRVSSIFTLFIGHTKVNSLTQLNTQGFSEHYKIWLDRGIYVPPSAYETWFVSSSHTDAELLQTKDIVLESLEQKRSVPIGNV
ncbi:MAG: glutamate-1-semialdehyde 2,1-aminomutase [Waddliaceae bacterium]